MLNKDMYQSRNHRLESRDNGMEGKIQCLTFSWGLSVLKRILGCVSMQLKISFSSKRDLFDISEDPFSPSPLCRRGSVQKWAPALSLWWTKFRRLYHQSSNSSQRKLVKIRNAKKTWYVLENISGETLSSIAERPTCQPYFDTSKEIVALKPYI